MTDVLSQYEGLLKQARLDVGRSKHAILNRVRMARGIKALNNELANEYVDLMTAASKGTDNVMSGGPRAVRKAIRDAAPDGTAPVSAITPAPVGVGDAPPPEVIRKGLGPAGVVGLLGAGGGGAYLAHRHGEAQGREEGNRKRNLAFGAGLATGAVAPRVLQQAGAGLQSLSGRLQQSPLSPYGGGYQ